MRCILMGVVVLGQVSAAIAADLTAEEVLAKVEATGSGIKDQQITMEMIVQDVGHEPRHLGMQVYVRGAQRRVQFLYPGDVKGVRVLTLSREQTYVYLPAFRKVRRIASHTKDQSMFGSDYNFDDASTSSLREAYTAQVASQDDNQWVLKLTPKVAAESPYGSIEVDVQKSTFQIQELRYFSPTGTKLRTETRADYACKDGNCIARRTKMTNHAHDNHWTEVVIKDVQVNNNIPDQIFSLRDFQRTE
ncbi:MAG TPA: outer membrane lipoprotein-sorting protein [Myxococcota bacterium]|nr:outer membrane lipoprotein-sorting protein [Myxococcota bacterium]